MHVELEIYNSSQFFELQEKEIDWDNEYPTDPTYVSYEQADLLDRILTTEASIYLLRRATGTDGFQVDTMASIRQKFIEEYNEKYPEYTSHNDFY